jgi:hypothetical protein
VKLPQSENKNASAPNRGEGIKRSRYHPFHPPPLRLLPDTCVGFVVNGSPYLSVRLAVSFLPALVSAKIQTGKRTSLPPVTWVDGAGYYIHRSGSKASSSSVLTGSHHPPALWKARNDYYSSSQPLQIFIILEKSIG